MVETITAQKPKFTTLIYQTKDGENITATKKDGVVTLVGDKNGVRQMELDKFIKEELPNNVKNLKLENSPEKDTVEISKPAAQAEAKETTAANEPKATQEVQSPKDTKPAAVTNPIAPTVEANDKPVEENAKKLDVVA